MRQKCSHQLGTTVETEYVIDSDKKIFRMMCQMDILLTDDKLSNKQNDSEQKSFHNTSCMVKLQFQCSTEYLTQ